MSVARNITGTFLTRISVFIIQGVAGILIARYLGPEKQGIYSLLALIPVLVATLTSFGLPITNTYFAAKEEDSRKRMFSLSLFTASSIGILLFIAVSFFDKIIAMRFFHRSDDQILYLLKITSITVAFILLYNNLIALILGLRNYFSYNFLNITLVSSFLALVTLLCFVLNLDIEGAVYSRVGSYVIAALLVLYLCVRKVGFDPRFNFNNREIKDILSYGSKGYLAEVAQFLNCRADIFLAGFFLSTEMVGYYVMAVLIAETILFLPGSIQTVLLPEVSSTGREKAIIMTARAFKLTFLITFFCILLLFIFDEILIKSLLGVVYIPSAAPLRFLLAAILSLSIGKIIGTFAAGSGRTDVTMKAAFISAAVNIVFNIILIPRFGITGAAVSSSLSYSLVAVLLIVWFLRATGLKWKELLLPTSDDMADYFYRIKSLGN